MAALQAAALVNSLANAGPFTVFAPTDTAFDTLPAGTVETLLEPENERKLETVLHHHVTAAALDVADRTDTLTMACSMACLYRRRSNALLGA